MLYSEKAFLFEKDCKSTEIQQILSACFLILSPVVYRREQHDGLDNAMFKKILLLMKCCGRIISDLCKYSIGFMLLPSVAHLNVVFCECVLCFLSRLPITM